MESGDQATDRVRQSWMESGMRWGKARLQRVSCAVPCMPCLNFSVQSPDGVWRATTRNGDKTEGVGKEQGDQKSGRESKLIFGLQYVYKWGLIYVVQEGFYHRPCSDGNLAKWNRKWS